MLNELFMYLFLVDKNECLRYLEIILKNTNRSSVVLYLKVAFLFESVYLYCWNKENPFSLYVRYGHTAHINQSWFGNNTAIIYSIVEYCTKATVDVIAIRQWLRVTRGANCSRSCVVDCTPDSKHPGKSWTTPRHPTASYESWHRSHRFYVPAKVSNLFLLNNNKCLKKSEFVSQLLYIISNYN